MLPGPGNMQIRSHPLYTFNSPPRFPQPLTLSYSSSSTITTAGFANAISAGLVLDSTGGAINATTPTAAEIVSMFDGTVRSVGFVLTALLTNVSASIITVVGGTNVTIQGTAAVPANTNHIMTLVLANITAGAEAVTLQISA